MVFPKLRVLRLDPDFVQAQLDTASPYVPRQDGSEGIGSYAQKLAKAGLDLSANPREVVYNHPMVGACFCHQCLATILPGQHLHHREHSQAIILHDLALEYPVHLLSMLC